MTSGTPLAGETKEIITPPKSGRKRGTSSGSFISLEEQQLYNKFSPGSKFQYNELKSLLAAKQDYDQLSPASQAMYNKLVIPQEPITKRQKTVTEEESPITRAITALAPRHGQRILTCRAANVRKLTWTDGVGDSKSNSTINQQASKIAPIINAISGGMLELRQMS